MLGWLKVAASFSISLLLTMTLSPKDNRAIFISGQLIALGLSLSAASDLQKLLIKYKDFELKEDMLESLKESQVENQLAYLSNAADFKAESERQDKEIERQLEILHQTAPIFSQLLTVTGENGPVQRMALGLMQKGKSLGDVLLATSQAEMQMQSQELTIQLQQEQLKAQTQVEIARSTQTVASPQLQTVNVAAVDSGDIPQLSANPNTEKILEAATSVGITAAFAKLNKAPSYEQQIFSIPLDKVNQIKKWVGAIALNLGVKYELNSYVHGSKQVAIEVPIPESERTFIDFPKDIQWVQGERKVYVGETIEGKLVINFMSEDTPQALVAGTTGSGKSNLLRLIAYCLLMQGCKVDICGGKVSDFEDFSKRFKSFSIQGLESTSEIIEECFYECDRRNSMTSEELSSVTPRFILIDEYKGTVPFDSAERKKYHAQTCEVARRGRGLKIHIVIGIQHPSLQSPEDPDGLPPDLRRNLPLRFAFRCVDAAAGRLILFRRGGCVPGLSGKGDGIVQSGTLDTRFQSYNFTKLP